MEVLTIVLASLLSLGSGGGAVLDAIAQGRIGSKIISVEEQSVRIDNQPNYQAAQGKLDRVRIASRGVKIKPGIRIAEVDLETDQVALKLAKLKLDKLDSISDLRESLIRPATGAARIVFTEQDLNQALQSPEIVAQLQSTLNRLIVSKAGSTNIGYQLSDLQLELLPANHLEVGFNLSRPRPSFKPNQRKGKRTGTSRSNIASRELNITLSLEIRVIDGKKVQIIDPQGTVNDRPMSSRLLQGFAAGIGDRFDLNSLSADGILARILQLEIDEDKLQLVSFVRLETKMQ
jgi:LmeA-like phospholipid-binding